MYINTEGKYCKHKIIPFVFSIGLIHLAHGTESIVHLKSGSKIVIAALTPTTVTCENTSNIPMCTIKDGTFPNGETVIRDGNYNLGKTTLII
jgi:hypothetical protein